MHVRSTPQGVRFFQDWLRRIIEGNVMNDQRDVNFDQEPNSIRVSDCVAHDNLLRNASTAAVRIVRHNKSNIHSYVALAVMYTVYYDFNRFWIAAPRRVLNTAT